MFCVAYSDYMVLQTCFVLCKNCKTSNTSSTNLLIACSKNILFFELGHKLPSQDNVIITIMNTNLIQWKKVQKQVSIPAPTRYGYQKPLYLICQPFLQQSKSGHRHNFSINLILKMDIYQSIGLYF